jgi:hypothetical protein
MEEEEEGFLIGGDKIVSYGLWVFWTGVAMIVLTIGLFMMKRVGALLLHGLALINIIVSIAMITEQTSAEMMAAGMIAMSTRGVDLWDMFSCWISILPKLVVTKARLKSTLSHY